MTTTDIAPMTYPIEVDYLEAWEVINALMERRSRLVERQANMESIASGLGIPFATTITLIDRAEAKLRAAVGVPAATEEWGGIEQYQAEGR